MDELLTVEAYAGYCKALMDFQELIERHDLKQSKKSRAHILAMLECLMGDPDRLMAAGGRLDLWWREEGKKVVYYFDPPRHGTSL